MGYNRLTKETFKSILKDLKADKLNFTDVALKHGVSRGKIYDIRKALAAGIDVLAQFNTPETPQAPPAAPERDVKSDRILQKARQSENTTKKLYKDALKEIEHLSEELDSFKLFAEAADMCVPADISIKSSPSTHEATPILVASDWHVDEVIKAESIQGLNEFNIEIARERVKRLFSYAIKLITMCKKESEIDTLVIAALGDFMSAWIHEELVETNSMTPPETILALMDLWTGGINAILESGVVDNILFVGCVGNHGRITKKISFKNRARKNYEWMLYNLLLRHYAAKGETRIKFKLADGYFNRLTLYNKRLRFHHGDNIRYQGGVGGVHIPVRKAIAQWDKSAQADLDVFGHWHTLEWSTKYVINNSLIGYSAYAENLKADYMKAGQALFLMHNKFGKTTQFPIILQD